MSYILLDYDGFICKAFYATLNKDEAPYDLLERLTYRALEKGQEYLKPTGNDLIKTIAFMSGHSWKKDYFPSYKMHRTRHEGLGAFRDFVKENPPVLLKKFAGLEADDAIIMVKEYIEDELMEDVLIFSDDKDLLRLSSLNCKINLESEIQEKDKGNQWDFYAQLLAGDKEDNIVGIPKVGDVTARRLLSEIAGMPSLSFIINIYKEKGVTREECVKNLTLLNPSIINWMEEPDYVKDAIREFLEQPHLNSLPISYEEIKNRMLDYMIKKVDKVYNSKDIVEPTPEEELYD